MPRNKKGARSSQAPKHQMQAEQGPHEEGIGNGDPLLRRCQRCHF